MLYYEKEIQALRSKPFLLNNKTPVRIIRHRGKSNKIGFVYINVSVHSLAKELREAFLEDPQATKHL